MLALLPASLALTYYTCRHTFEPTLIQELGRAGLSPAACRVECPAAVRVSDPDWAGTMDPVYALQTLPSAHEVEGASVSILAAAALTACVDELAALEQSAAPRGALTIHSLVPDLLKGGRTPRLLRRCEGVGEAMSKKLRARYAAARPVKAEHAPSAAAGGRWLLQLLLLDPERLVVSLSRCSSLRGLGSWPCAHLPAGLARVDLDGDVPSSAYRKLLEAFACMQRQPAAGTTVVDLGACPGGWTVALRRLGCAVVAVDRSELAPAAMRDPGVSFVPGDAFAYRPPWADGPSEGPTDGSTGGAAGARRWMVSDVIAYPERVPELIAAWAGGGWAEMIVVTMKFQSEPSFDAVDAAADAAADAGFAFRAKHFFNNKNEVTCMLRRLADPVD